MKTIVGCGTKREIGEIVTVYMRDVSVVARPGTQAQGRIAGESTFEAFVQQAVDLNGRDPNPFELHAMMGRFYYEVEVD